MKNQPMQKEYVPPVIKTWGTVAELTQTGNTNPTDSDFKGGSKSPPGLIKQGKAW